MGADALILMGSAVSMCVSATFLQHYWLFIAGLSTKLHALLCWEMEPQEKSLLFHRLPAVRKCPGKDTGSFHSL